MVFNGKERSELAVACGVQGGGKGKKKELDRTDVVEGEGTGKKQLWMEKGRERNAGEVLEVWMGLAMNDGRMSRREFPISLWRLVFYFVVSKVAHSYRDGSYYCLYGLAMRPFILGKNLNDRCMFIFWTEGVGGGVAQSNHRHQQTTLEATRLRVAEKY
jgi:hypothetical protein